MKDKIKDIAERAIKTFIQGFLGSLAVLLPNSDYSDLSVLKSVIIGALAGGLSALMNLLLNYINKDKTEDDPEEAGD